MYLLVEVEGETINAAAALRSAIREVDRDITVSEVGTMEAMLSSTLAQPRFRSTLVGLFALVALVLSSIGLYGVLALFVRQQSHEISVRMALGAGGGRVCGLVVKQGMMLVGTGLAIGVVAGLAGARLIRSALFGVGSTDPVTYVGVCLVVILVASVACAAPTLRAVRLDPAEVMKAE